MKKKLNILFLNSWYPSKVLPTNGDFIQRHAEAVSLKQHVYAIHVVSKNQTNNFVIDKSVINNVTTLICYIKTTKNPILKWILFLKGYLKTLKKLPKINVIHLNVIYPAGIFALYLKWLKNIPFIISEHWTGYHYPMNKSIGFFQKLTSKIICKNASYICPVSTDLEQSMKQFGLKGNYYPIPNVVDTSIFNVKNSSSDVFTIIHISNMKDDHKNVTGILNVIKKFQNVEPNFKLILIGENSSQYQSKITSLKIIESNVAIFDQLSQPELVKHLQKSNVFVLFSNYENLPCVILESFACGVPVITTNVGGINEYFPKAFGNLISKGDENALLNKLIEIKTNPKANKNEMHEYVLKNFSKPVIADAFSKLYYKSL